MYALGRYGIDERGVVSLVLIGIRLGEGGDRSIEDIGGTQVARDGGRVAGSGVTTGEVHPHNLA